MIPLTPTTVILLMHFRLASCICTVMQVQYFAMLSVILQRLHRPRCYCCRCFCPSRGSPLQVCDFRIYTTCISYASLPSELPCGSQLLHRKLSPGSVLAAVLFMVLCSLTSFVSCYLNSLYRASGAMLCILAAFHKHKPATPCS